MGFCLGSCHPCCPDRGLGLEPNNIRSNALCNPGRDEETGDKWRHYHTTDRGGRSKYNRLSFPPPRTFVFPFSFFIYGYSGNCLKHLYSSGGTETSKPKPRQTPKCANWVVAREFTFSSPYPSGYSRKSHHLFRSHQSLVSSKPISEG